MKLILASTSLYRKQILEKLHLPFDCASPNVDEMRLPNETPEALVQRLALEKAQAVGQMHPNALIIGSDQVAVFDGQILGKPHTPSNAIAQLLSFSGKKVIFYTGLTVLNSATNEHLTTLDFYEVIFRNLSLSQIESYVAREHVLDCAGSIKCEGLGVSLIAEMRGKDFNTLIGLPLIDLIDGLNWAKFPFFL